MALNMMFMTDNCSLFRNVPVGQSVSSFVETCEACGALYGKDFTYKCLTDKSAQTFKGCYIAVHDRR